MPRKEVFFSSEVFDKLPQRTDTVSELEALMSALPFQEPPTVDDIHDLRQAVADAVGALPRKMRTAITLVHYENLSLKQAGNRMGFSDVHVMRLRDAGYAKLRDALTMNVELRKRYATVKTWEQSATQWVGHIASMSKKSKSSLDFGLLHDRIDSLIGIVFHNDKEPNPEAFIAVAIPVVSELRKQDEWDTGEVSRLLAAKQHDYGHKNIDKFGLKGIVVRLNDKYERLTNLEFTNRFFGDGGVIVPRVRESLVDTLTDIVGYCVIGLMVLDDTFKLELGEDYAKQTDNNRI